MTPEEMEWASVAKAGRTQSLGRGARWFLVVMVAGMIALVGGYVGLRWAVHVRADRIARYERGEVVVVARGGSPYGYDSGFVIAPCATGLLSGAVVLALGMAFLLKDRTYLRGLGRGARDLTQ